MKKLVFAILLAVGSLSAQAGGYYGHGGWGYHGSGYHGWAHGGWGYHNWGYRGWGWYPGLSFSYYGGWPAFGCAWPGYAYSYYPAPTYYSPAPVAYSSYPATGYVYTETRPNYAIGGTLLGALTGGLIGNSVHHQGWEGAGIGAAAGLVLGSLAEHDARAAERTYYVAPPATYVRPAQIPDAPTVNNAPAAPAAPRLRSDPLSAPATQNSSSMSSANSLFGR